MLFGVFIADPRILPSQWEPWRFGFVLLHWLAFVSLVAVALAWSRHNGRRPLVMSAFISLAVVVLAFVVAVRPSDIPIDWITIIHETLGHKAIRQLYTRTVHAGVNFAWVTSAIASGPGANLHDVVWLNLLLALVNAVIFLHIGLRVTTPIWAVAWTLVFALNPAIFFASFSELPTNLLALYFLAGVVGWVTLNDPSPQPRLIRVAAFVLCAVLTVLSGLTRPEVSLIGLLALTLFVAHALLGAERWAAAGQEVLDAGKRALVFLTDRPVLIVVLSLLGVWFSQAGLPFGLLGRSELTGLYPFSSFIYSLFIFLPMMLLPVGVTIGTFFGFVRAGIDFRLFGGLALSLFILVRMYFAAQNQYYETGRYLSYVLPAVFLLGVFGFGQLNDMARHWRPLWRRGAQLLFIVAWFGRPMPGIPDYYTRPEYHYGGGFAQVFLDLNMQREIRHLLTVTENNPACVFVGRVIENFSRPDEPKEYAYAIFGQPIPAAIFVSERDMPLDAVIAKYAPGATCVRLYFGGDCNLTDADGCKEFIAGRRLIDEERFWSRIYNNPHDYGYAAPEVVLQTYEYP